MPALTSAGAVPRADVRAVAAGSRDALVARLLSVAAICALPVLAITADVLTDGPLRRLDDVLAEQSWHRADAGLTSLAFVFDRLGQRAIAGTVLVLVAAFLAWRLRAWRPLLVTGAGLAILNLVVGAMKLTIGRSKPLSGHDLLYVGGSQFPSGHASNAVVTWGLVAYVLVAYGGRRVPARTLAGAAAVTTLAVCSASLYLNFHWLTDLLGGMVLGVVLLALVIAWDVARVEPVAPWSRVDDELAAILRAEGLAHTGRTPEPAGRIAVVQVAARQV